MEGKRHGSQWCATLLRGKVLPEHLPSSTGKASEISNLQGTIWGTSEMQAGPSEECRLLLNGSSESQSWAGILDFRYSSISLSLAEG